MHYLLILMFALAVILILMLPLKTSEKKGKVDKGIEFCYWKLSYRRKLIRTIWMLPVVIVWLVVFYRSSKSHMLTGIFGGIVLIMLVGQMIYNCVMIYLRER